MSARYEHALARSTRRRRGAPSRQRPTHRLRMHPELPRDIADVDTALHQCLNHHEVLLPEHPVLPPFGDGKEDILRRCLGDFLFRRSTDFYHRS